MTELPENYSFYSQYIDDIKAGKVVSTKVLFWSPFLTYLPPLEIQTNEFVLKIETGENKIKAMLDITMPTSLYNDLKNVDKSSLSFLIGYISKSIPFINLHILNYKYAYAHIITTRISAFDIQDLLLINTANDEKFMVPWPMGIANFPFTEVLPSEYDYVYIRDFLDAITSYLYYDFDDCIRRIMTSFDNAVIHYGTIKMVRQNLGLTRNDRITFNMIVDNIISRPELNHNIHIMYKTRNKIVHDELRLESKHDVFMRKAIGTMFYVLKGYLVESRILSDYIGQIELQYMSILEICRGWDIDDFIKSEDNEPSEESIIENSEQMDNAMFSSIKITDDELPY